MTEAITAVTAIIAAAISVAESKNPALVLVFLMVAFLAWRLYRCEKKHAAAENTNDKLLAACIQMGAVLNTLSGNEVVDVSDIEGIMAGKDAVKYGHRFRPPKLPDPGQSGGA